MRYILLVLLLSSCWKNDSAPEEVLKTYVESRMDASKFVDMENIQKKSFKILSKDCKASICAISYSVSYTTKKAQGAAFTTSVNKMAKMVLQDNQWLISSVQNINTIHESLEAI